LSIFRGAFPKPEVLRSGKSARNTQNRVETPTIYAFRTAIEVL